MSRILYDPIQAAEDRVAEIRRNQQKELPFVTQQLNETINRWNTNSNKLFEDQSARVAAINDPLNRMESNYWAYRSDASEWEADVNARTTEIENDANTIRNILDEYESYFDAEWVKNIREGLKSTSGGLSEITKFAQSSDEYSQNLNNIADLRSNDPEVREAANKEYFEKNKETINKILDGYVSAVQKELSDYSAKEGRNISLSTLGPQNDNLIGTAVSQYMANRERNKNNPIKYQVTDEWSEEAKNQLAIIYNNDPKNLEEAKKFAERVNLAIQNKSLSDFAGENLGTAIAASIASVPLQAVSGFEAGVSVLEQGAAKLLGKETEAPRNPFADAASSYRQGVTDSIDGDFWKLAYNTGMSMIDMGVAYLMAGGIDKTVGAKLSSKFLAKAGGKFGAKIVGKALSSIGTSAVMGGSAAASTMNDVLSRGGTGAQAASSGVAAGIFEFIWEAFSLGELKTFGGTSKEAFKAILKGAKNDGFKTLLKRLSLDALSSAAVNASEEAATELSNILYDSFVNKDISNYTNLIEKYLDENPNATEKEAREYAAKEFGKQIGEAAASGALMGLVLGAGGTVVNYNSANTEFASEQNQKRLLNAAKAMKLDNASNEVLQKALAEFSEKGQLSTKTINDLYRIVAPTDYNKIELATANRLAELGDNNAEKTAAAIVKKIRGYSLNAKEQNILKNSKYSERVINELNPENNTKIADIPDWVKNIGTSVVNSRLYNLATVENEIAVAMKLADIFAGVTAANPKADVMKDAIARSSGVQRLSDGQKKLREIGQSFGAKVIFDDLDYELDGEIVSPEGEYDPNTNTITLNTNVKDYHRPVQFILKHELTHSLEKAGVDYEQFMGMVELSNEFEEYLKKRIEAAKSSQEFKEFEQTFANENDLEALSDFDLMIQYTIYRYNENGKPLGSENETAETAAKKELTADFVADVLFNGSDVSLEKLLKSLQPETRNKFIEAVKNIIAKLKEIFVGTPELTEIEQLEQKFLEIANKVKKMNAADPGQQKTTTGDGSGVKYSFSTVNNTESKVIIQAIENNIEQISKDRKFDVSSEPIPENMRKSDYVLSIFDKNNRKAYNKSLGIIDLTPSGAKSTVFHGFGGAKLTATKAIVNVIENGDIISHSPNYEGKSYDRYIIAAKGLIDGKQAYIGVVIKTYPNNQKANGKFYLHEAVIIETDSPIMTAPQLSVDTVSESESKQSIPENGQPVNSNSMQTGKKYSFPGPKALTANLENLEKAKEREKSSDKEESDNENIRRDLGWFRGLDRIWRYEIDDSKAIFTLPHFRAIKELIGRKGTTLGECLKHDELFAAYPELRDINVEFVSFKELKGALGGYDSAKKTISINLEIFELLNSHLTKEQFDKELLITIIHEVQHAIQDIEGFASGSSEAYWEAIEQEHTEHLKELSRLLSEIRTKGNKELADLACRYVELKQEIYKYDVQSAEVEAEIQQIEKKAKSKGCYKLLGSFSLEYLICKSYEEKLGAFSSNFERYQNTAGEIEAEDVKKRFNLLSNKRIESDGAIKYINERVETRPDIDRKNVLFVEGKLRKHIYDIAAKTSEGDLGGLARSKGYSQKLYHQTGSDFTVFDTEHQKAGKYDPEMPTGTFLKPDDSDIGLSGKKQMELFTKIKNPLQFKDRADAQRFWMRNIEGYAEALRAIDRINERYSREVARAGMELSEYKKEWRRNNPDADNREIYNDAEFQRLDEAQDQIAREWDDRSNEASLEAKKLIDGYMVESGYDGVVMENDVGSNGKSTKTYVVFDSSQMKSANAVTYDDNGNEIPLSARFDSSKKDIRYSMPERRSEISKDFNSEEYDKLVSKKAIKLSKQEWSKINSQRTKRYADIAAENIPTLDLFRFAEYNKIDEAYSYVIRNIDKYTFSVISKRKIDASKKEIFKERKKVYESTNRQNVENENTRRVDRRGDNLARHGRTIREDEFGFRQTSEFELNNDFRQGASNIGGDVKLSLPEHPTPLQIGDAYKNGEITREEYDPQNSDVISEKTEYEKLIDELAEYLKQKNDEAQQEKEVDLTANNDIIKNNAIDFIEANNDTQSEILIKNKIQGRTYEKQEFAKFSSQNFQAVEQITIRTASGTRTRVDAVGINENGNVVIHEFKSSATAALTKNQRTAFPEIVESGGVIVGKGKGIFYGGYQIPAGTSIKIIRPE